MQTLAQGNDGFPAKSQVVSDGFRTGVNLPSLLKNNKDEWVHLTWSLKVTEVSTPIKSEWSIWVNGMLSRLTDHSGTTIADGGIISDMAYPGGEAFQREFIGHSAWSEDESKELYLRGSSSPPPPRIRLKRLLPSRNLLPRPSCGWKRASQSLERILDPVPNDVAPLPLRECILVRVTVRVAREWGPQSFLVRITVRPVQVSGLLARAVDETITLCATA